MLIAWTGQQDSRQIFSLLNETSADLLVSPYLLRLELEPTGQKVENAIRAYIQAAGEKWPSWSVSAALPPAPHSVSPALGIEGGAWTPPLPHRIPVLSPHICIIAPSAQSGLPFGERAGAEPQQMCATKCVGPFCVGCSRRIGQGYDY